MVGRFNGRGEGDSMSHDLSIEDRFLRLSPRQRHWLAEQLGLSVGDLSVGDENKRKELVAWVVADRTLVDDQNLRREMSLRLPSTLVPRRIIRTDMIPKTSTGKIDRNRLAAQPIGEAPSVAANEDAFSDSERTLIRICGSLLKVVDVLPQDNFYHIGGDSLLSIQLIALARQNGMEIEPRDVLECSSIAELACASDQRTALNGEGTDQSVTIDSVVSKVRSSSHAGSILLVHEVGGRCHYAHYLAAKLASDLAIYVSNQPPTGESPESIERLARRYADAWLVAEPDGPHIIVAFCWGGLLAYEIARQLKENGVGVDKLMIVESGTEASYVHAPWINRKIDRMKGNLIRVRSRLGSLRNAESIRQLAVTLAAKTLGPRNARSVADAGFQFREDEGDPEQIRKNVQAFLDYAIDPEELPLHLFRVGGPTGLIGTRYSDRSLGWRYLVGPGLTLHRIPGNHDTCMKPPHVSGLAEAMNRVITA